MYVEAFSLRTEFSRVLAIRGAPKSGKSESGKAVGRALKLQTAVIDARIVGPEENLRDLVQEALKKV